MTFSSNGTSSPCKSKVEALEGEDMGSCPISSIIFFIERFNFCSSYLKLVAHSTEIREWLKTSQWLGEDVSTMINMVAKHWFVVTVRMTLKNLRKRSMNFVRVKIVF